MDLRQYVIIDAFPWRAGTKPDYRMQDFDAAVDWVKRCMNVIRPNVSPRHDANPDGYNYDWNFDQTDKQGPIKLSDGTIMLFLRHPASSILIDTVCRLYFIVSM